MDGCKSFLKKSPDTNEIANSGHWYSGYSTIVVCQLHACVDVTGHRRCRIEQQRLLILKGRKHLSLQSYLIVG